MDSRKENFKRIAEKRTSKIIDMISLLGNLANKSYYEYTEKQIETIFTTIQAELDKQRVKFDDSRHKKNRFQL